MMRSRYTARGFTIVEATIAVGIVGILIAASTGTFGAIAKSRKVEIERRSAYLLGQQLMNEILQTYFQDPYGSPIWGPESGETRSTYDDVDDYDGFTENSPTGQDGTALAEYSGWKRSVSVAYVDPANPSTVLGSSTLKRVLITVTAPSGKTYTLTGLRSQMGEYEQAPTSPTTYITGVSIALQGASPTKTVYSTAHPLNISTSQN